MVDHQAPQIIDQTAQQSLTNRLLAPLIKKRRPQRVLLLKHALAADIICDCSESTEVINLSNEERADGAQIFARLSALPFEDVAFDLIVLQHLISDGNEVVMAEAMRVLAPGGDIIISGLNYAGLRYHSSNRSNQFPAIKINKASHLLKSNSFNITHSLRSGFAGLSWPKADSGWSSSSLPFTDRVALQAHHRSGQHTVQLSSLDKVRSASVSTAVFDAVSRRKSM